MKITPEEVDRVARLARLELTEEKRGLFVRQLHDILSYMDQLAELDTTDVSPMYGPVEHTTVLRADETRKDFARAEVLANAPEDDGSFFIVPRIV